MQVCVMKLRPDALLPTRGSEHAAGYDLYACLQQEVRIDPGETKMIPTGLAFEIPVGYAGFIYARSGLASKQGLAPANKVGVCDCDYRGEYVIALYNQSSSFAVVHHGDRIAQLVVAPYMDVSFQETDHLSSTQRGQGGFGSTGIQ